MLEWIKSLPESTARERIYKLVALADYFSDRESVAVDYMRQALKLVEETGAIEFLLRQHKLFDIIIKAAHQLSTPFTEDIARRITDRARENQQNRSGSIPVPLTTRELEVIRHLATGKPISAISEALHVSMNTMKTHLRNIYRKLDVDGRESAVEKAKSLFLI
jgi:ATP/maltotriose-dependent transcriptional regulator MalT